MDNINFPINIGGTEYNLRYGMKALIHVQEKTGKSIFQVQAESNVLKNAVTILHAGLIANHPDLSFDDVCDLIDQADLPASIFDKAGEALNSYTAKIAGAAKEKAPTKTAKKKTV